MDINLFKRHLAKVQKIDLNEDDNGHKGIKNDFVGHDYAALENAKSATDVDVKQVKDSLKASGAYEITVKKDYNNIHASAYLD